MPRSNHKPGISRAAGWRKEHERIHGCVVRLGELSSACISSTGFMHRSGVYSLARRVECGLSNE